MSIWDILDKRFGRPPEPVTAVPLAEGDECPEPRCRGTMKRWTAFWDDGKLICNACGWHEAPKAALPFPDFAYLGSGGVGSAAEGRQDGRNG